MNIEQLASIYVDIIEPLFKLGSFFVLVVVVLHALNIIKYGGSGGFVGSSYAFIARWTLALVRFLRRIGHRLGKIAYIYIVAFVATVRDFLSAKS